MPTALEWKQQGNEALRAQKYEDAIKAYFTSEDDLKELRELYERSDPNQLGYISKDRLKKAIKEDLMKCNEELFK